MLNEKELAKNIFEIREWQGSSSYDDVRIGFQNGQMRARNNDQEWSLYFND